MKKRFVPMLIAAVAMIALWGEVPPAQAGKSTDTISIHFGADEPTQVAGSMLAATDVTGAVPSSNWNNETLFAGVDTAVMEDLNDVVVSSSTTVIWYSSNTWASTGKGEENNNFVGADHTLMSGYLDMEVGRPAVTFIQVSNLPASFSGTYDVYIYSLPGVAGRGGLLEVNGNQNRGLGPQGNYQYLVSSGTKDPTKNNQGLFSGPDFVPPNSGDDSAFGANDFGNYVVFFGVTGPTVDITAVSMLMPGGTGYDGTPRLAINGIQIVSD